MATRTPRGRETSPADRTGGSGLGATATGPVPPSRWTEATLAAMVLVWAVNFSAVKWALDAFRPLGFNALRFLVASLFVYAVLRIQGPIRWPERQDWPRLLALGVLGNVVYQVAFIVGLDLTRAGNASVMMALTPIFIALLSWGAGHERSGLWTWVGAGCSVAGVALVSTGALRLEGTASGLAGDLILVGAGLMWALYTVGARDMIRRYGPVQTTAWTMW